MVKRYPKARRRHWDKELSIVVVAVVLDRADEAKGQLGGPEHVIDVLLSQKGIESIG